jgi:hypothetical protein
MNTAAHRRGTRGGRTAAALLLLCLASAGRAATLVKYDFEGKVFSPSVRHALLSASGLGHSGDGTTNFYSGYNGSADALRATKWPTNAVLDDCLHFSITVPQGFLADVTNMTFAEQRSPLGPAQWVVQYSTNGAVFHGLGAGDNGSADTWHAQTAADRLPEDLAGTVHFRLYATNAVSGAGTWRVDDITLNGSVRVDTGMRNIRFQGFDGAQGDNWAWVAQAGSGTVAAVTARSCAGARSLELAGSAKKNADPFVVFTNVNFPAGLGNVSVSVAFSADGPDQDDDLYLDVSHDNGATWNGAGSAKLVDGFDDADVAFGATSATNPATVGANPYTFSVSAAETRIALRVRFDERATTTNLNDRYYVDSVRLRGTPVPGANAPTISNYGGITGVSAGQATVRGHVTGGYPYPDVTVYWGPADGGTNASAWSHETALGSKGWGVFSNTLSGLSAGQVYFYRCHARNVHGSAWAGGSTNFATGASPLSARGRVCLDSFGVSGNRPLCVDRDGNGLSDTWEEQCLGATGGDPDADPDLDGWSNRREFLAGTDPTNAASHLRITGCDLNGPASYDIAVAWTGGDFPGASDFASVGDQTRRSFIVSAASGHVTNRMAPVGSVADNGSGTNSYTDAGAAGRYARRYYTLGVNYGGATYSNIEEWAVYTQNRPARQRFLVCVPVDMPDAADENLNAAAGRQLARGLHAGKTTGDADALRYLSGDGAWKECFLLTNAAGQAYWYDEDMSATANVPVTAGMAFWLVRGTGAAARTNAVFAGKSFSEGAVADFAFKTNYGGWTAFGWPLARERSHRSGVSAPNQLGFYAVGEGGRTSDPKRPNELGDQIWTWENNTWRHVYWLIGNSGTALDGRWWDSVHAGGLANFSLEPGRAYYYRRTMNFGGTNFNWRPHVP